MEHMCTICQEKGTSNEVRTIGIGQDRLCRLCFSKYRRRELLVYSFENQQSVVDFPDAVPHTVVQWRRKKDYSDPILEPLEREDFPLTPEQLRSRSPQQERNESNCRLIISPMVLNEDVENLETESFEMENVSCNQDADRIRESVSNMVTKNEELQNVIVKLRKEVEEKDRLLAEEKRRNRDLSDKLDNMKQKADDMQLFREEVTAFAERVQLRNDDSSNPEV